MPRMNTTEFIQWVEKIVRSEVVGAYPNEWFEDYLTLSILKRLRARRKLHIMVDSPLLWDCVPFRYDARFWRDMPTELNVTWSSYKLTGKNERRAGDVAVLVSLRHKDGDIISGIGFMEAKKSAKKRKVYSSIRRRQLSRILKSAPRSYLLLYDWRMVCSCGSGFVFSFPPTGAVVVPVDIALACGRQDDRLHKYSKPLSIQLLTYLTGFELERSREAQEILYRLSRSNNIPRYLLQAFVGIDEEPPEDTPPPRVEGWEWEPLSHEVE